MKNKKSMPYSSNFVFGIKLDMGNKQMTYYAGAKTFTVYLPYSEYQLYDHGINI